MRDTVFGGRSTSLISWGIRSLANFKLYGYKKHLEGSLTSILKCVGCWGPPPENDCSILLLITA